MNDYRTHDDSWSVKGARFVRFLTTRKAESWYFFLAGFIIAAVFT